MIGFSTLLATVALCLIAWAMESKVRRPLLALPALLTLAVAIGARLFGGGGLIPIVGGLFLDLGAGLLVAGTYLKIREAEPRRFLIPGALSLLIAGTVYMPSFIQGTWNEIRPGGSQGQVADHFLLELGPDDSLSEVAAILQQYEARAERAFPRLTLAEDEDLAQYYIVFVAQDRMPQLMDALLSDRENVDSAELDVIVEAVPTIETGTGLPEHEMAGNVADDPRLNQQWGFLDTKGNALHRNLQYLKPAKTAIVAIVDTGVDDKHEDIRDTFDKSPGTGDANGHGTHCAGVAGAATNNGLGIASYNWDSRFVKIRSYKALGSNGGGSAETVAQAIIDAARDGADVISLSLGSWSPVPPKVEVDAIEFAMSRGAIVVAAAGNAASEARDHAPANIKGVISVAAVDQSNRRASFSNRNSGLSRPIAAPGVGILSLKPGNGYVALNGTSMATPHVAGLLGVMRAIDADISAEDAYELIRRTGVDGPDAASLGRTIDAENAVEAVRAGLFGRIPMAS